MIYSHALTNSLHALINGFFYGEVGEAVVIRQVNALDYAAMCAVDDFGNTLLANVIVQKSLRPITDRLLIIRAILSRAFSLDTPRTSGYPREPLKNAVTFLLTHENRHGHSAFHYALIDAPVDVLRTYFHALQTAVHTHRIFNRDLRKVMIGRDIADNSPLDLLFKTNKAQNMACYFDKLRESIWMHCLTEEDYRSVMVRPKPSVHGATTDSALTPLHQALTMTSDSMTKAYLNELKTRGFLEQRLTQDDFTGLFSMPNSHGFRLLDRVLLLNNPVNFLRCFELLAFAYRCHFISVKTHLDLLCTHIRKGYSILHELLMHNNLENIVIYMGEIKKLKTIGWISERDLFVLFTQLNTAGFAVVHQAANSYSSEIAHFLLDFMKTNLSDEGYYSLLNYRTPSVSRPKCGHDKPHAANINRLLTHERGRLKALLDAPVSSAGPAVYSSTYTTGDRFFTACPRVAHRVDDINSDISFASYH